MWAEDQLEKVALRLCPILIAAKPTSLVELTGFFLLSFFFLPFVPKRVKTVQTNMVAYVIWAIYFKSEVRSDL